MERKHINGGSQLLKYGYHERLKINRSFKNVKSRLKKSPLLMFSDILFKKGKLFLS